MKVLFSIALAFSYLLSYSTEAKLNPEKLHKVLALSGTKRQTNSLPEDISNSFDSIISATKEESKKEYLKKVQKLIYTEMSQEDFFSSLKQKVEASINEKELKELYDWYSSDLAKKISELEVQEQEKGMEGLNEFAQSFNKNPPPQKRAVIIGTIVRLAGGIPLALEIQKLITFGTMKAINNSLPVEKRQKTINLLSIVELQASQLEAHLAGLVVIQFTRMYQTLSDKDLLAYAEFLESTAGMKFTKISAESLMKSFKNVSERLSEAGL